MNWRDRLHSLFAKRVVRVRLRRHRPGSIQREHGRDVVEHVGLHLLEQLPHRGRVELEDPQGLPRREQFEDSWIVVAELFKDQVNTAVRPNVSQRVVEDVKVTESEEVHLDETQCLARRVVELGDDLTIVRSHHERDDVGQFRVRHNHTSSVDSSVAFDVLDTAGGLINNLGLGRHFDRLPKLLCLLEPRTVFVEHLRQ